MDRRSRVRDTYDRIASHFARTRPTAWEAVATFLADRSGTTGLDLGVGNGRHAEVLAERVDSVVGVDISRGALSTARERSASQGFELALVQADAVTLPLRTACVDLGVYVAAIHHLPDPQLRIASLDELARVLRSRGVAIVSAWCVTHDRFDATIGFDTTIDWTLPDGERVPRFYHIYDSEEFSRDLESSDLSVLDRFDTGGNCYAVVGAGE